VAFSASFPPIADLDGATAAAEAPVCACALTAETVIKRFERRRAAEIALVLLKSRIEVLESGSWPLELRAVIDNAFEPVRV
jgi:hypothetical protein